MDDIDRLMNNLNVPAELRNKIRKQLAHSVSEFGHAQLVVPQNSPMNASMVPVPPGVQFKNPGGEPEAMAMEEACEEDESPEPTLTECYLHDLVSLRETITLCKLVDSDGSPYEKQELMPVLRSLRDLLARNMKNRSEDAIGMIQLDEHDRKDMQAKARFGRWQCAVSEGRTKKSYANWLSDYERQDQGSVSGPTDKNDNGDRDSQ